MNVCFRLNRKGLLSIQEICHKTGKKPEDVKRILKRLHDLGYLRRNQKGQVEVHMGIFWEEEKQVEKRASIKDSHWLD